MTAPRKRRLVRRPDGSLVVTPLPSNPISVAAAARAVGVTAETIRRWCADGSLVASQVLSGRWLIASDGQGVPLGRTTGHAPQGAAAELAEASDAYRLATELPEGGDAA